MAGAQSRSAHGSWIGSLRAGVSLCTHACPHALIYRWCPDTRQLPRRPDSSELGARSPVVCSGAPRHGLLRVRVRGRRFGWKMPRCRSATPRSRTRYKGSKDEPSKAQAQHSRRYLFPSFTMPFWPFPVPFLYSTNTPSYARPCRCRSSHPGSLCAPPLDAAYHPCESAAGSRSGRGGRKD